MRAGFKVGDVAADVRQGPNQLEVNLREGNPIDKVQAAIGAACQAGYAGVAAALDSQADAQTSFEALLGYAHDAICADDASLADVEAARVLSPGRFNESGPAVGPEPQYNAAFVEDKVWWKPFTSHCVSGFKVYPRTVVDHGVISLYRARASHRPSRSSHLMKRPAGASKRCMSG